MSDSITLNQHQKKALVIQLYEQGKTIRQIAEVVHMGFKDISDVIKKLTCEENDSVGKREKSKDARAFELFLQGKKPIEVAIELDMSADEVEELCVQYWRLSKLHDLETLYHEAKYSLSPFLQLFRILKENKITKNEDISTLIELAGNGLPYLKDEVQDLSNQVTILETKKAVLNKEILRLRTSIHENNEVISRQNGQSKKLDRKLNRLYVLLQDASKDPNYKKMMEIVDQGLNDRKPLLVAAVVAVIETLKKNP